MEGSSAQLPQLCDAASVDPLGDEDIPVCIEAGVMRMKEFARYPAFAFWTAPEFHAILKNLSAPFGIFAQVDDDFVVLVEERDTGTQVGHQQHVSARIDVRGQDKPVERL